MNSAGAGARCRLHDAAALVAVVLFGAYYAVGIIWWRAQLGVGNPSYDLYGYFYPSMAYALRSLRQGHGLLWNALQNCGQPFFADPQTALLYPPFAIFLLVSIDVGVLVLVALHLAIGGAATYFLCLELGLAPIAALCGAFTFELGGVALELASWQPILIGSYVWIPLALLLCERVLRREDTRAALWLGLVLTVQLLAGFPQMSFFTYQFIVLRAVWALVTREVGRPLRPIVLLASALVLAPLLAAVDVLPVLAFAHESIRGDTLTPQEVNVMQTNWEKFRRFTDLRMVGYGATFAVIPAALAGLVALRSDKQRAALFYLLAALLYLALAFDNPVSRLYHLLPLGSLFRGPERFLWMTAFGFSVAVAFGADALAHTMARGPASRLRVLAASLVGAGAFYLLCPSGFLSWEWGLLGIAAIACAGSLSPTRLGSAAYWFLPVLVAVNLVALARPFHRNLADAAPVLERNRDAFAFLAQRLTPEGRMHPLGGAWDLSLMPKSASIFGVPGVSDYQPMASRRFAELYLRLFFGPDTNVWLENINQLHFTNRRLPASQALLNLTAARYLLVDTAMDGQEWPLRPALQLLREMGSVRIYENPQALPRAFYVPRVAAVSDRRALLDRLSSPLHDPRALALLDDLPADGFTGTPGGSGEATIVQDRSEELRIDVHATSDGFLFLADQYYPGWEASVNGRATPVYRANHAFRLVRVPAGESRVVFRYRPGALRVGLAVSLVTLVGLAVFVARQRRASKTGASDAMPR